ncbi:MAG: adenine phosphoribosyltransferase [Micrococcales bacterium]|nr:adenine phosphoribosyltransferase [Micrococcales bacterium]MCL2666449.1 adenine phosphoribosyltransferase [Micrococcales bacterium]
MTSTNDGSDLSSRIDLLLRQVQDFPEPGVLFRDITPLLADGPAFAETIEAIAATATTPVDLVVGIESRGFLLAAPVATALGVGLALVRKAGKLPGPTVSESYTLEYGTATVEVHPFTVPSGSRVLVVDDVLATGGTAAASVRLLERCGAQIVQLTFLIELLDLHGRAKLPDVPTTALLALA